MKNKIVRIALAFFAIFTMTITGAMADTLEKAKTTGKFTLAYRESSIPFSYLGED
jgi:glutamate/aspartate transport system substrate-binding protein